MFIHIAIAGIPKIQPLSAGGECRNEQRRLSVQVRELHAHGQGQDQRHHCRFVQEVLDSVRESGVVGGVRQLPECADAGAGHRADHFHRQDGRLPDVSVRQVAGCGDHQLQVIGNERSDPDGQRRLCKCDQEDDSGVFGTEL